MAEHESRRKSRKRNNNGGAGVVCIQRRILVAFIVILLMFVALTFRVGWIQIVAADQYAARAAENQIKDIRISPARGSILDRNMNELAVSTVSYRVWARLIPATEAEAKLQDKDKLEIQKKAVAELVSSVAGVSKEDINTKLNSDQPLVRLAGDLTKPQIEAIREGINDQKISILEIEERSSRRYPLGTLAAKIIGSVNYDGLGQAGVELTYDKYLSGVAGRQIARVDGVGSAVIGGEKAYYESRDGLNVVTTIDESIQYFVQDALDRGLERTGADRMMAIVYDPKTGDILAMADTDPYDPNDPGRPMSEEDRAEFGVMTPEEQTEYLSRMWRNPCISDTYDPGSTFKSITVSSGLEDGVITPESWFNCNGYLQVYDRKIECWSYPSAHGGQSVRDAVANSCNPVMMQIVKVLGYSRFYNYLELFGLTEKTGIDLPGEENSLVQSFDTAGPVGLATMAFGQGLSITPVQMVTAVGSIANDGKLMIPRVVRGLADDEGNMVEEFTPKIKRQVMSENTAAEVREILNYVSQRQLSPNSKISGYNIGVKTGTTLKLINGEYSKYHVIGSMFIMAPIEDPQFVVLVLCDTPRVGYYGIETAGPVVNEISTELLRYLNIKPSYTDDEIAKLNAEKMTVYDYTNWTLEDARASIEGLGLRSNIGLFIGETPKPVEDGEKKDGDDEEIIEENLVYRTDYLNRNLTVVDQYPKPGMTIAPGGVVYLYWD